MAENLQETNEIENRFKNKIKQIETLKERACSGFFWFLAYPVLVFVTIFLIMTYFIPENEIDSADFVSWFLFAVFGGLFFKYFAQLFIEMWLDSKISKVHDSIVKFKTDTLKDDKDFFANLVDINLRHLDQYYRQTQNQANKSFLLSIATATIGFILICVGVYIMYLDKENSGLLAATAGVLSEFISAVIFYLYNKTVVSMAEYHTKLVMTQNISLALKSAEILPDDKKAESIQYIIKQLGRYQNNETSQ